MPPLRTGDNMLRQGNMADLPGTELPKNCLELVDNLELELIEILDKIALNNGGVWLVGGCVRDSMLGLKVKDIDLAVDLSPERMMEIFPDAIPTGLDFGCVTLRGNTAMYEATTLRSESGYSDARRPDSVVLESSLSKDLERRDFTINSMAIDVARKLLHDPHQGSKDIKSGVIKSVGIANNRLKEDGLRILRAYRFMDRGSAGVWPLNPDLSVAVKKNSSILKNISSERIRDEFLKILAGSNCGFVIRRMIHDGVLQEFSVLSMDNSYSSAICLDDPNIQEISVEGRLAILFSNLQRNEFERFLTTIRVSNEFKRKSMKLHQLIAMLPTLEDSSVRLHKYIVGDDAREHLQINLILSRNSKDVGGGTIPESEVIEEMIQNLSSMKEIDTKPLIDGKYIMANLGIPSGAKLGRLKEWLHKIQIERGIEEFEKMETIICSIPWNSDDYSDWPRMEFNNN